MSTNADHVFLVIIANVVWWLIIVQQDFCVTLQVPHQPQMVLM